MTNPIEIIREHDTKFKIFCVDKKYFNIWQKRVIRREWEKKNDYAILPGPWDRDLDNYHDAVYTFEYPNDCKGKLERDPKLLTWTCYIYTPSVNITISLQREGDAIPATNQAGYYTPFSEAKNIIDDYVKAYIDMIKNKEKKEKLSNFSY